MSKGVFGESELGLSYCLPSSCRGSRVAKIIANSSIFQNPILEPIKDVILSSRITDDFCHTKEEEPFTAVEYAAR